jgi:hypothetical protein
VVPSLVEVREWPGYRSWLLRLPEEWLLVAWLPEKLLAGSTDTCIAASIPHGRHLDYHLWMKNKLLPKSSLCFGLPWPSSESQHQRLTQLPFWEAGHAGQGNQWCGKKASHGSHWVTADFPMVQRNSLPSKSLVLYLTRYIQRTLPMSSHT